MTEQVDFVIVPEVTLGWRIQIALDHAGLKQTDLMEKFEVSRGTVSRWCRDIHPAPKKYILNEIAVMCGVSARWLINGEQETPPDDPGTGAQNPAPIHYKESSNAASGELSCAEIVPLRPPQPAIAPLRRRAESA